jgi:hypothetical protein
MPNGIELGIHSCFLKKVRVELLSVDEDSVLDESLGLSLAITPRVNEGGVDGIHFFGLFCG